MDPLTSPPPATRGRILLWLALVSQLADTATFLVAVMLEPRLVSFELGPIGVVYQLGGPLAATAFKIAGLAVVFAALAVYRGRLTRFVLLLVVLLGTVGAAANIHALLVARGLP